MKQGVGTGGLRMRAFREPEEFLVSLHSAEVADLGYPMVLGNTFHLFITPGEDHVAQMGGLHEFMAWRRPIITDSGGFQVFSMGHGTVADEIKGRAAQFVGERLQLVLAHRL